MTNPGFGGHRHGVKKNILESLGGAVVGVAAVLFLASVLKRRPNDDTADERPQANEG